MMNNEDPAIDACVICALGEEAEAFLDVVSEQCQTTFDPRISHRYGYDYRVTTIQNDKGEILTLHVSWLPRLGPQETMLHLLHVLEEYAPRFAAKTGICAGDRLRVHLGDLVVAERTYIYDNGKFVKDRRGRTVYQHDTLSYPLHENILRFVQVFKHWKPLVAELKRPPSKRQQREWLLNQLLDEQTPSIQKIPLAELEQHAPTWRRIVLELQQGSEPLLTPLLTLREKSRIEHLRYGLDPFPYTDCPEAKCFIMPMASGSAVRSDDPFKDIRVPVRGTVAIDMEGAAFCRTMASYPDIPWLVVKGVSDYADSDKDDSYHRYASSASALYLLSFIKEYVTNERLPRSAPHPSRQNNYASARNMPAQIGQTVSTYSCVLSFSEQDQAFAEQLYDDLQKNGVQVWFAPEDIKIGDKKRTRIEETIHRYDKLLLVLSVHAVESDWVEFEVEAAFDKEDRKKTLMLFPIRLDSAVMDSEIGWAAHIRRTRHIGDFTRWKSHDAYQKAFSRLLRDLKAEA